MIFGIIISLIFIVGFTVLFFLLKKKFSSDDEQIQKNLQVMKAEEQTKMTLLRDLAGISLGYVTAEYFEDLVQQAKTVEEEVRTEKGRITITEAELEAVDVRLRELEELKRELEMSSIDAIRELELLRAQERDITQQNDGLKGQLKNTFQELDQLLEVLASNTEAVNKLHAAKKELMEAEVKHQFYQEQIALLNQKYVGLKKAYDALDIEYAQLYEKQQQA